VSRLPEPVLGSMAREVGGVLVPSASLPEEASMKFVISAGHGLIVRGAVGPEPYGLDEVDEARRVVPELAKHLRKLGHTVVEFYENEAQTQSENLENIVAFHNSQTRNLDISVHFNAYVPTDGGRGTEVLYVTQEGIAARVASAIAEAGGLINRGAHHRSDLYFLNQTTAAAILIEVAFVDAEADVEQYNNNFEAICQAIADVAGPASSSTLRAKGKVSWFGGPDDQGVTPSEGLAFLYSVEDKPELFLKYQPSGTTGLARRLNPDVNYVAMRWNYDVYSKDFLRGDVMALVTAPKTGKTLLAHPADWGPHVDTSRVADISLGLMEALGIDTDDVVEVSFPYTGEKLDG
jgi:N-acetylmuramoyl-L-alanine amidase